MNGLLFVLGVVVGAGLTTLYFVYGIKMLKARKPLVLGADDPAPSHRAGDEISTITVPTSGETVGPRAIVEAATTDFTCVLTDWGPDFANGGEVLPRWRWVLAKGHGVEMQTEMLGNAETEALSVEQAATYMDQHHPAASWKVLGGEGEPQMYVPFSDSVEHP